MMKNLPEKVSEEEIEEMFAFADVNKDGKISYNEFQVMINPAKPVEKPKPNLKKIAATKSVETVKVKKVESRPKQKSEALMKEDPRKSHCATPRLLLPHESSEAQLLSSENLKIHDTLTLHSPFKNTET